MGGLEMRTRIQSQFQSLHTAEKVVGGACDDKRLGGNSLLDCVVFGRVAEAACAKYALSDMMKTTSLAAPAGGNLRGHIPCLPPLRQTKSSFQSGLFSVLTASCESRGV